MKSSIAGESFHRQDFSSVALQRKNQAGKHWLAIHENGARAAFPQLAAVLRTRVPKILAQNFQQSLIGSEREVGFLAIQSEPDLRRLLRFNRECSHFPSPRESAIQRPRALAYSQKLVSE